jgi:hypothetical protein
MNEVGDGLGKMLKKAIVSYHEAQFVGVSEENNECPASGVDTLSSVGK